MSKAEMKLKTLDGIGLQPKLIMKPNDDPADDK